MQFNFEYFALKMVQNEPWGRQLGTKRLQNDAPGVPGAPKRLPSRFWGFDEFLKMRSIWNGKYRCGVGLGCPRLGKVEGKVSKARPAWTKLRSTQYRAALGSKLLEPNCSPVTDVLREFPEGSH